MTFPSMFAIVAAKDVRVKDLFDVAMKKVKGVGHSSLYHSMIRSWRW